MKRRGDTESWRVVLGGLHVLASELSALVRVAGSLPWRSMVADTLGDVDGQPVPCVLVHGVLGDATNFATLRRHLARHDICRFSSFSYRPRLDYQRLARRFGEHVSRVCRDTGAPQVDVVAHSLGGLIARYFVQTDGVRLVRRLVTLGTPYLGSANPPHELSIFARHDVLVPPPVDRVRRRMQVVDACGHLGLLTDDRALAAVARYLTEPALVTALLEDRAPRDRRAPQRRAVGARFCPRVRAAEMPIARRSAHPSTMRAGLPLRPDGGGGRRPFVRDNGDTLSLLASAPDAFA
jgi:pimeloyl-ACP methyl ester carboxylesterase